MIDRLFTAVLAFCLLAGGAAAIGSAWFRPAPAKAPQIAVLPTVTVIGQRLAPPQVAQREASEPGAARVQ